MKTRINVIAFLLLFAACVVSCSKQEKSALDGLPEQAALEISQAADKFFSGDSAQKKDWIERQAKAWVELNTVPQSIPLADYSKITKNAQSKYPDDFEARLNFVREQVDAYNTLDELSKSVSPSDWSFVKSAIEKFAKDDLQAQSYMAADWINFNNTVQGYSQKFPEGTFQTVLRNALDMSKGNVSFATEYMQNQYYAAIYISTLKPYGNLSAEQIDAARAAAAKEHPSDMVARRKFIESALMETAKLNSKAEFEKRGAAIAAAEGNLLESSVDSKALDEIFNFSVFTKSADNGKVHTAVYVEFNGKPVVLCSEGFISNGLPVNLSNGKLRMLCSTAYVAQNLPMVMLIPDTEPEQRPKLKVISDEESAKLSGKKLLMFSPENGSMKLSFMKCLSDTDKYYNLKFDSIPNISGVGADSSGGNVFVTLSESTSQKGGAIVMDFDNKLLVSYAIQTDDSISDNGKLADFKSLVEKFGVSGNNSDPKTSQRFMKLVSMDKWDKFDQSKSEQQKEKLRKLSKSNAGYMVFFKENLYSAALKNEKVSAIARKYREQLVMQKMDQDGFLRRYKSYMYDIMNSMRQEEARINPQEFYSIYRDAASFQFALRKAMFGYLSDAIKENHIVGLLHTDLRTRYQNPSEPYEIRDFSGSLGTSF